MDSDFEREMIARAVFAKEIPETYSLSASKPSGRLWVGVVDPDVAWDYEHANAWDVFEPDGLYLGRIPIPPEFRPTRVTDEHIYGIWQDELDISYARRYRIIRPGQ